MKKRTKIVLICVAAVIIAFVVFAYITVMNPFNIGIDPLTPAGKQADTGRRIELSFTYAKQRLVASSQYAFWIEEIHGSYVDTVYVTQWTAAGGFSYRPLSIPMWVSSAQPSGMSDAEIDAISGATPGNGDYVVTWDLTDRYGNPVTGTEFLFFFEGTMNNEDNVLYAGIIRLDAGAWTETPDPVYTQQDSAYKGMLTNVRVAFYPGDVEVIATGNNAEEMEATGALDIEMPDDFGFSIDFGILGRNNIDTFNNTFTKDLIIAGNETIGFTIPQHKMRDIFEAFKEHRIYELPDDINAYALSSMGDSRMHRHPNPKYSLTYTFRDETRTIVCDDEGPWDTYAGPPSARDRLVAFVAFIAEYIYSTEDFKTMSPPEGGYD